MIFEDFALKLGAFSLFNFRLDRNRVAIHEHSFVLKCWYTVEVQWVLVHSGHIEQSESPKLLLTDLERPHKVVLFIHSIVQQDAINQPFAFHHMNPVSIFLELFVLGLINLNHQYMSHYRWEFVSPVTSTNCNGIFQNLCKIPWNLWVKVYQCVLKILAAEFHNVVSLQKSSYCFL